MPEAPITPTATPPTTPVSRPPTPPITPTATPPTGPLPSQPTGRPATPPGDRYDTFVGKLPEAYRQNPEQFIEAYQTRERELEAMRPIAQWFEQYQPWFRAHQQHRLVAPEEFAAYQQWRQAASNQPAPQTPAPSTLPPQFAKPIDWDEPDAPKQAYERLGVLLQGVVAHNEKRMGELGNWLTLASNHVENQHKAFMQLVTYQQELEDLERQHLYKHLNYSSPVKREDIVQYALAHGITDRLGRAHEEMSRGTREDELRRLGYDQGRRDYELEVANRHTSAEMTSGIPSRLTRQRPSEPTRGYGATGKEEILRALFHKHGVPTP